MNNVAFMVVFLLCSCGDSSVILEDHYMKSCIIWSCGLAGQCQWSVQRLLLRGLLELIGDVVKGRHTWPWLHVSTNWSEETRVKLVRRLRVAASQSVARLWKRSTMKYCSSLLMYSTCPQRPLHKEMFILYKVWQFKVQRERQSRRQPLVGGMWCVAGTGSCLGVIMPVISGLAALAEFY